MADSRLARRLGCTDGQVWTLGIAVVLAGALIPATFPAGLRPQGDTVLLPAPALAVVAGSPVVAAAPPAAVPISLPPPALGVLPPIPLPGVVAVPVEPSPSPASSESPSPQPTVQPLQVVSGGWYDSDTEATFRQQVTPSGELPVSADAGARAATSLLRLSGNASTLVLVLDGTAGRSSGTAVLELCRNTTSTWTAYDAMPASSAPPVDKACTPGTAAAGRWSFEVGQLGAPDDPTGFTLRAVVTGARTETFAATFVRESPS